MKREFTATVFIIDDDRVLLLFHHKFQKWMPSGGHLNPNETPTEAAIREVYEETGLHVQLMSDEACWYDEKGTKSLARPHSCFVYDIPDRPNDPAHQHVDFVYLAKVVGGSLNTNMEESASARWFTNDEVQQIPVGQIFENTRDIVALLLAHSQTRSRSR